MNPSILTRHQEIEAITLTPQELERVIWQAKIVKWNEERNKEYWRKLEGLKPKEDGKRLKNTMD